MSPSAVSDVVTGRGAVNWVRRKPAQKFEWGTGANLLGILTAVSKVSIRDQRSNASKVVTRYNVQDDEREMVFFFGSVQLDELLRPSDVGHYVNITCTGEDKTANRNGNAMKIFDVQVSQETAPGWAHDGTPITDKDVPDTEFFG